MREWGVAVASCAKDQDVAGAAGAADDGQKSTQAMEEFSMTSYDLYLKN
jgi:hypothetical protein